MNRLPPPQVVVTDGGAGIRKALRNTWPKTRVQRCLFHVKTNTITDLTRKPKTAAGKALLALTNQLLTINTPQEAANWIRLLHQWHQLYELSWVLFLGVCLVFYYYLVFVRIPIFGLDFSGCAVA